MLNRIFTGMISLTSCIFISLTVSPVFASNDDGCWSGRHSRGPCLEYNTYEKENKTYVVLNNVCNKRLYVRWCANQKCGSDHVAAGKEKKKYEYVTGAYVKVRAIGSEKSSQDWVCADSVSDWRN